MAEKEYLGQFEELVLLGVVSLGMGAYGVPIREALEDATERSVSIGALYATLDRLERKGFVHSWLAEPTQERGGRAKRYYEISGAGKEALRNAYRDRKRLVPRLEPSLK